MKPAKVNLINSSVLIILGMWGFAASNWNSTTALIAPSFGIAFLILAPFFQKERKIAIYLIVGMTLLLMIALVRPLTRELGQGDYAGVLRVTGMMFSCIVASVVYFKVFVYGNELNDKGNEGLQ